MLQVVVEVSGSEAKGMKLPLGFDQCNWTLKDVLRGKFEMRMLESHLWSEEEHCWSFLVVDARIISLRL